FHHTVFSNLERLDELWPSLETSEESPAHKEGGDGERPVDMRVVQAAPLGCDSSNKQSGWQEKCGILAGFNVKSHPDPGIGIGISIVEVFL
uniref:Uncharacterized protein n=1 Tax=Rhinopithecus bieti TaxID=61621 RepID=A0A2K6M6I5_RHIBE